MATVAVTAIGVVVYTCADRVGWWHVVTACRDTMKGDPNHPCHTFEGAKRYLCDPFSYPDVNPAGLLHRVIDRRPDLMSYEQACWLVQQLHIRDPTIADKTIHAACTHSPGIARALLRYNPSLSATPQETISRSAQRCRSIY